MRGPGLQERISALVILADEAERILRADTDWGIKFDAIFPTVSAAVLDLGFRIEYYDPDTSYEEDVRAYVEALREYADRWRPLASR